MIGFNIFSDHFQHIFLNSTWFTAGIISSIYALIKLKPLLNSSWADKIFYFFYPLLFVLMMGLEVVNLI